MTGSCEKSSKKNSAQYFIPKVHANNHDSLLDCEITAKEQSRNLDLESIPFDFWYFYSIYWMMSKNKRVLKK